MNEQSVPSAATSEAKASRRDVLRVAAGAAGAVGVIGAVGSAAFLVLRLNEAAPDAPELVRGELVDVDVSALAPGQQIVVFWRSWPVMIVRRTPQMLAMLREPALLDQLADPDSRQIQQPPYASNWGRSIKPEFSVLVGICTHMGCPPQYYPDQSEREPEPDWRGGYLCPCHGSKYDLAGRVFKDVPAPLNLPVPPHRFVNDRILRIGENSGNVRFDFASIMQI
jgi:ubiquinol-cytochrome c reductase iron-sulfur subunit